MIPNKGRETRRSRSSKISKNLERLIKHNKCRECSVSVTRMDFAKILGKFTKVKIQYECSSPRSKSSKTPMTVSNSRLKCNENGMVLIHRNAYNKHPVKELLNSKKSAKGSEVTASPLSTNILKENNRIKKTQIVKDKNFNYDKNNVNNFKRYGIIFTNPSEENTNDSRNKISLLELLPVINKGILPSEEWCIDYFPKSEEPKDDKVYDRIAAELEDLMNNEETITKPEIKDRISDSNGDDFPSIMDILNDTPDNLTKANNQNTELKTNLESNDVEAMLLGKDEGKVSKDLPAPMDVDESKINHSTDEVSNSELDEKTSCSAIESSIPCVDNPASPSILDEALKKGIEEHLPGGNVQVQDPSLEGSIEKELKSEDEITLKHENQIKETKVGLPKTVTHIVFKKTVNNSCVKSVTCPKTLKYNIELEGKHVEFLGAPKFVSSLEDLKVLLQIVNETELQSLYVLQ